MRRFNPEKELYKIQHGRKNKIFIGAFLLLLVISISSTYAIYQVRYSKRIIYTKVAPFSNKDIELAVKVEGAEGNRNTFPTADEAHEKGLGYIGMDCEKKETTTGFWNYDTWSLDLNTKGSNKCTVLFGPIKDFSEIIIADNETLFEDDFNNIRYAGPSENVHNYVWFNCNDYNAEMDENNCEKWRIIGLFKNVSKPGGTSEDLVKIIRADSVGNIAWGSSNNWTNATLKQQLENYYTGSALSSAKGIEESARSMIEYVTWNLGGGGSANLTAKQFYNYERLDNHYGNNPLTWPGYIGLIYPSDYGYATTGSNSGDNRNTCLTKDLYNYTECKSKDWLHTGAYQWTIVPYSNDSSRVYCLRPGGDLGATVNGSANTEIGVQPSLYLKSRVKIKSGAENGSSETPYILIP